MVSLSINVETLGNLLLPGCLLHGKYCDSLNHILRSLCMNWWTYILPDHISLSSWFHVIEDLSAKIWTYIVAMNVILATVFCGLVLPS